MKHLCILLLAFTSLLSYAQKIDSKTLLSGSDLSYYKAAEMEIDTYLKSECLQLQAAKRAMILDYGLLNYTEKDGTVKRNVVGLKRVQGWNAVMQVKYNCTEKNYYDFTRFFRIKTN